MKKADMQKQIDCFIKERQKFISMFGLIRDAIGITIGMNVDHDGIAPEAVVRNILENKNLINSAPELLEACKDLLISNIRTEDTELLDGTHEISLIVSLVTIKKVKESIAKAEAKP
jgi:hypothetical protein